MANPRRKQCGKDDCKRAHQAARMREFYASHKATTGQTYNARYHEQRRVADKSYRERTPHWRQRHPVMALEVDARRGRRLAYNGAAEAFTHGEIFERDGWLCGLCQESIDPALAYPDPMSASLDHVTPLSKGGTHARANVRATHLTCNLKRGAGEATNDQLTLITIS
jgi:5-methylcytosine-specific restriction endonuclease McrA